MSPDWSPLLSFLVLLLMANGGPVLAAALCRGRPGRPLDGGRVLRDGRPLLGPSKTWRGLGAALAVTALVSWGLGLGWGLGLVVALGAMAGDLLASLIKRRLGWPSGTSVPVLDQVPESLIPGLLVQGALGLDWLDLALAAAGFLVLDLALTPVARWLMRAG